MNPREGPAASHLRLLFEEIVDLEPDERAARLGRLDPNDPDVARVVRLLDAHDHATQRLGALEFLRAPDAVSRVDSSFDAAAAFAPSYTIEGELDGGGMSRVFFGRDAKLGRKIVAKVLPTELGAEVKLGRFQQEIKLAAQLRHPHIVPLLESGEAAGCLYYTMPFIEGESLRDRLRRDGNLPVPVALRFATEIADALAYAHGLGVIHRDIKPGNVLIDSGHAVVTDFGIARALSDAVSATVTRSGTVIGTPAYMSPEQSSADGVVDVRTDVYSLGCVLYEMLYGAPGFGGAPAFRPTARASGVRVPSRVRAILACAMAPLPADRFQSATAVRDALLAAAAPRLGRRTVWSAAAACVALLLGAGVAFRPRTDHSFASREAVVRQVTTRGDVQFAAISPHGNYVAYVTSDTILRVAEIETGMQEILIKGLPFQQIWWSADQNTVFFATHQTVTAIPKVGPWRSVLADRRLLGPIHNVWRQTAGAFGWGFAMSPTDSSLAYFLPDLPFAPTTDRRRALIVHTPGGTRRRFDTLAVRVDVAYGNLSFSPNGKWLAACGASRDGHWRLALISVDGTTQRLLDSASVRRPFCGAMWSARGDSLRVWSMAPDTDMVSFRIDDVTGKVLGALSPFRVAGPRVNRTAFTLSAGERRVAYVAHATRRYVGITEFGAGVDVASHDANVGAREPSRPQISPVGDRFAYVITDDSGSAVFAQDLRGGEPRRMSRAYREGLSGVRWSDDGTRIATVTRRDSHTVIVILDTTGAEIMTVRPKHSIDTTFFRPTYDWAARSTGITYVVADLRKGLFEVWLIDLASGRERILLSTAEANLTGSLPAWSPDGKSIVYTSLSPSSPRLDREPFRVRVGNGDAELYLLQGLRVKDVQTGATHAVNVTGASWRHAPVLLLWRADGTFFMEMGERDGTTTIWRTSPGGRMTVYARLGKECRWLSMDGAARRGVCQVFRNESDVFVVTRP